MKNEKESKEKVQKSSSSTSEVLESVDLTLRATASTEPHILNIGASEADNLSQISKKNSRKKSTTKTDVATDVLESVLEATTCQVPTTSGQQFLEPPHDEQPVLLHGHVTSSQPNLRNPRTNIRVYRSAAGGIINSTSAMHNENFVRHASSKISLKRVPPSYSTVLKLGIPLPQYDSRTFSSVPFITRQPPPSYAEVHGRWDDNSLSMVSSDSFSLGPNPVYISCPRCRTIVISDTHSERSHMSYLTSLMLCICMCWPCCLLPFCIKSFRNTYHFCPTCHYYLGVYRPC